MTSTPYWYASLMMIGFAEKPIDPTIVSAMPT
jgi:hypothetical protein